jgi:hypothetical protein
MEVIVKEITIVKVSEKTSMETALEEVVSKVIDLIIDIIHHHHSFNKRSAIYMGSLDTNQ